MAGKLMLRFYDFTCGNLPFHEARGAANNCKPKWVGGIVLDLKEQ